MSQIPESLRRLVVERAGHKCEYCLVREGGFFFSFEVDHIISLKHEGDTDLENLALACGNCNRHKGANLGTYLDKQRRFVRLFDPRRDAWSDHFDLDGPVILPKTRIGRATIQVLEMNDPDRVILRQVLVGLGEYP
ncbi:MAG: HNH endonuclease [Saprospiraceae bacterium]